MIRTAAVTKCYLPAIPLVLHPKPDIWEGWVLCFVNGNPSMGEALYAKVGHLQMWVVGKIPTGIYPEFPPICPGIPPLIRPGATEIHTEFARYPTRISTHGEFWVEFAPISPWHLNCAKCSPNFGVFTHQRVLFQAEFGTKFAPPRYLPHPEMHPKFGPNLGC